MLFRPSDVENKLTGQPPTHPMRVGCEEDKAEGENGEDGHRERHLARTRTQRGEFPMKSGQQLSLLYEDPVRPLHTLILTNNDFAHALPQF